MTGTATSVDIEQSINKRGALSDSEGPPPPEDMEALLARIATPETPKAALAHVPGAAEALAKFDPLQAASIIGGLLSDVAFQAHTVRLEWALRWYLSNAKGTKAVGRGDLYRLLNTTAEAARITWLEDPIEDFFIEAMPSKVGDVLVYTGIWEKAAAYTESVLEAFEALEDFPDKAWALECAYALLRLGDDLARRSNCDRWLTGEDAARSAIRLPTEVKLRSLAKRVHYTSGRLKELGLQEAHLAPFTLQRDEAAGLASAQPGNSSLERFPLIATPAAVIVAAPPNITTAVRGLLFDLAVQAGLEKAFSLELMLAQSRQIAESTFMRMTSHPRLKDGVLINQFIYELSAGRFVHVLQLVDHLTGWPQEAFGSISPMTPAFGALVNEAIIKAKAFSEMQPGFVEGMTLLFIGGWGRGVGVPLQEHGAWRVVPLSPSDATVLSGCHEGNLADLWRLAKQENLVSDQGFHLQNMSGTLNLFHWWRETDHALVPPGWSDAKPPAFVSFGHNLLLKARQESAAALDRRSALRPDGTFRTVIRMEPKAELGDREPIYVWPRGALRAELSTAVILDPFVWWVDLDEHANGPEFDNAYELAKALLHWLVRTNPLFRRHIGAGAKFEPIVFHLRVGAPVRMERALTDQEIRDAVRIDVDHADSSIRLEIDPIWNWALHRVDNRAEVLLAAKALEAICALWGLVVDADALEAIVVEAAGSPFTRWRHAFTADRALDELNAMGLVPTFRGTSVSADAINKCGLAWRTRSRGDGPNLNTKAECVAFLAAQSSALLSAVRTEVTKYDRSALVTSALNSIQSALVYQQQWRRTASATRAIHGSEADHHASLKSFAEALAVVRGASILTELAACDGALTGGRPVGRMDMEELENLAMLHFHTADTVSGMIGDQIKPEIRISPTGDVLSSHEFEEVMLQRPAERRHREEREEADERYTAYFEEKEERAEPNPALRSAFEAEFHVDFDAYLDLAVATNIVGERRRKGVYVLRRSELLAELQTLEPMQGKNLAPLVDRLTLQSRARWDDWPAGATASNFDFSKFDRQFSLVGRPIVAVTQADDPELAIAPAVIERAVMHNLQGAWTGNVQGDFWQSSAMRSFVGERGRLLGEGFNDNLAAHVRALGLQAWPSAGLPWCLGQRATDDLKALGDIDVLAATPDGSIVWVLEAKDLKLCRTRSEVARRLSEYQGKTTAKGKPDKMLRHLRRVEKVRAEVGALAKILKLPHVPRVFGAVVVRSEQPMQQVSKLPTPDARSISLREIDTVPWAKGW